MNDDGFVVGDFIEVRRRGKRGIFTADYNHQGRHHRRSLKTTNRKLAERRAWELHEKLLRNEIVAPVKSLPLEEAVNLYVSFLRTEGRSPKTITKYESELKRIAAYMRKRRVATPDQITPLLFDGYREHRRVEDGITPRTSQNLAIVVKQFLRFLLTRRAIAVNPLADIRLPKVRINSHPAASGEQVDGILGSIDGPLFAIIAALAFTGMRLDEAIRLRLERVKLDSREIKLAAGLGSTLKTDDSTRDIPIHPRLLPIVAAVIGTRDQGLVFQNPQGGIWNPRRVNELFKNAAGVLKYVVGRKNLGLTVHALRRFFETSALDAGVPGPLVDRWMGHADATMKKHYYKTQLQQEWMSKLPFGNAAPADLERLNRKSSDD